MRKLRSWSAKPYGYKLRIEGIDEAGKPYKLSGVDEIAVSGSGRVFAIKQSALELELLVAPEGDVQMYKISAGPDWVRQRLKGLPL